MIPFKLDQKFEPLEDWGDPEQAGATSLGGPMKVGGKVVFGSLAGPVHGGLYEATRGRFRVRYPYHEHSTVREGILAITDEATGTTIEYGPGDSWIIAKDAPIIWDVRTDKVLVSFLAAMTDLD